MLIYYADKAKDYPKGIETLDKMLVLFPTTGEENDFIIKQKANLQKLMANPKAPSTPKTPTNPKTPTKSTGATTNVKKEDKSKKK